MSRTLILLTTVIVLSGLCTPIAPGQTISDKIINAPSRANNPTRITVDVFDQWYRFTPQPPFEQAGVESADSDSTYLPNARFSVTKGEPDLPAALVTETDNGALISPGYWIVHFEGGVDSEAKALLDQATGATVSKNGRPISRWYIPNGAMIAYIDSSAAFNAIIGSDLVDWLGPYHPAYKLSPNIGRSPLTTAERLRRDPYLLNVDLMPGANVEVVVTSLLERGLTVADEIYLPGKKTYDIHYLIVEAPANLITEVAMVEGVRFIQEAGDGQALYGLSGGGKLQNRSLSADDQAASPIVTASDFPLWLLHDLQGQGQLVGVVDTSLDWNNTGISGCSFGFPDTNIDNFGFALPNLSRVLVSMPGTGGVNLKIPFSDELGGATLLASSGGNEHGSAASGSALADFYGNDDTKWFEHDVDNWEGWAPTNYSGLMGPGIAHEAQLYFTPMDDDSGSFRWEFPGEFETNMDTTLGNMSAAGVCTTNHSVGIVESNNTYTQTSVVHDTNGFDHPDMLQFMAAGNDGKGKNKLNSQAVVKNAVAVGASDDVLKPEDRVSFSSTGPCFDSRTKPDVMAPGDDTFDRVGTVSSSLMLPDSNGTSSASCANQYTAGTSFSSPIAAGAGALIHQYFEEGRYSGSESILDASAALIRAVMTNCSQKLTGANLGNGPSTKYPSVYQGWGEPKLTGGLEFSGDSRHLIAFDVDSSDGFSGPSDSDEVRSFDVDSSSEELRATLAWTDEPGSTGNGKKLINDLHLIVTTPGGTVYYGNEFNLNAGVSVSGGSPDTDNVVENIIIPNPAVGAWTVTVQSGAGNYSVPQGYALVITGDVSEGIVTPPNPASNPSPANGASGVSVSTSVSWAAGAGATSHDVYFGTTNPPTLVGNQSGTSYNPGTLSTSTTYFWRIDEVNSAGTTSGSVWSFTTEAPTPPGSSSNPNPANGATDVSPSADLSWSAGSGATSHDVYFGTSNPPSFQQNQGGTAFDPGALLTNTTYFWRIDEVNSFGTTSGAVWSFTTSAGASTMHVAEITLSVVNVGQGRKIGRARVTIVDNLGDPVPGVTVTGSFTGDYVETQSASTNADGVATIDTVGSKKGQIDYTFCVDDVTGGSLIYNAADNVITCESY